MQTAANPGGDRTYHILTLLSEAADFDGKRDLHPFGLFVGAQGRAKLFKEHFLTGAVEFVNEERGLTAYSGDYKGLPVSIVTSNMGPGQMEITLVEAIKSGLRVPIRVGSCGLLIPGSKPGEPIIVKGALRLDGQEVIVPMFFPAIADFEVTSALDNNTRRVIQSRYYAGIEATINSFYFGQGRKVFFDRVLPWAQSQFETVKLLAHCCSMEAATEFVICSLAGLPAGAINVGYGNRLTDEWLVDHDQKIRAQLEAGRAGLETLRELADTPSFKQYVNGNHLLTLDSLLERVTRRA